MGYKSLGTLERGNSRNLSPPAARSLTPPGLHQLVLIRNRMTNYYGLGNQLIYFKKKIIHEILKDVAIKNILDGLEVVTDMQGRSCGINKVQITNQKHFV